MANEDIQILQLNLEASGGNSVSELIQLIDKLKDKLSTLKDGTSDYSTISQQLQTINEKLGKSFLSLGNDMKKSSVEVKNVVSSLKELLNVYRSLGNLNLNPEVVEQLDTLSNAVVTLQESAAVEEVTNDFVELSSGIDMSGMSVGELVNRITDLNTSLIEAEGVTEETAQQVVELLDAYRELGSRAKETDEVVQGNVTSYKELTLEMKELKKIWRETNDEAERTRIGARIKELNEELKGLDATIGNYQRNVGNYAGAMTDFSKVILSNLGQIDPSLSKIGLQIRSLIPLIKSATKSATAGLTGIKAAIASTGIGLLVVAVGTLIANFDKIKEKAIETIPYLRQMFSIPEQSQRILEGFRERVEGYGEMEEEVTEKLRIEEAKRNTIRQSEKQKELQRLQETREARSRQYDEIAKDAEALEKRIAEVQEHIDNALWWDPKKTAWEKNMEGLKAAQEKVNAEMERLDKIIRQTDSDIRVLNSKKVISDESLKNVKDTAEYMQQIREQADGILKRFVDQYENILMSFLSSEEQLLRTQNSMIKGLEEQLILWHNILEENGLLTNNEETILLKEAYRVETLKYLLSLKREEQKLNNKIEKQLDNIKFFEEDYQYDDTKRLNNIIASNKKLLDLYGELSAFKSTISRSLIDPTVDATKMFERLGVTGQEAFKKISMYALDVLGGETFATKFIGNVAFGSEKHARKIAENWINNAANHLSKYGDDRLIPEINGLAEKLFEEFGTKIDFKRLFGEGILDYLIPQDEDINDVWKKMDEVSKKLGELYNERDLAPYLTNLYNNEKQLQENQLENMNKFNSEYKDLLDERVQYQRDYIEKLEEVGKAPTETIEDFNKRLDEENLKLKQFMQEQQSWIDENTEYWLKYSQTIADSFANIMGVIGDSWFDMIQVQLKAGEITQEQYNRQFENLKMFQIAEATINTISGAIGAFMQASKAYPAPYGQILGGATAAAVTAAGIAEIAKIARTTPDNTNRPSWGTTAPTISNPVIEEYRPTTTQNLTGQSEITALANALAENPLKAYVLESDVSTAQELARKRNEESTF